MPEHIKALAVIVVLAAIVFRFSRGPVTSVAMSHGDFVRRRNLWFLLTAVAFVSGNFWIYMLAAAVILLVAVQGEQNRVALYIALLFALPPVGAKVTGFGLMEHSISINHVRLLALTVLLPTFLSLVTRPDVTRFGRMVPDKLLLAYLVVSFGVMLSTTTFTNVLRHGVFYAFVDIVLPYYVASRSLRDLRAFRDALASFVVACLVLSALAIFEMMKHWLLYAALIWSLDVPWGYGNYLARGGFALRAQVTAGQPIALGFVLAVGVCLALYTCSLLPGRLWRRLFFVLLGGGLFAALSRGPWIGVAVGLLLFVATSSSSIRVLAKYVVAFVLAAPFVQYVPGVDALIDLLPFVGSTDAETIAYRRRLLETALDAIWMSPWFGGVDIYSAEGNEALRQHYGAFIDVVNSYIEIMLVSGLVGFSLFVGFFVSIGWGVFQRIRVLRGRDSEQLLLGRTILAMLSAILVVIFTVSSITVIPVVYWLSAGLAVAFLQLPVAQATQASARPTRTSGEPGIPSLAGPGA